MECKIEYIGWDTNMMGWSIEMKLVDLCFKGVFIYILCE